MLDIVEYEDIEKPRKYTLAHMLCLIIEVSPLFSEFKTKYSHDSSFRICKNAKCCNPYHRSIPNKNSSKILFLNRFNLFCDSFNNQLLKAEHQQEVEDVELPCKKQKTDSWEHIIPTRLFIGTFYDEKKKLDTLNIKNRIHFAGSVRTCNTGGGAIEIECVSGANEHVAWVPLRSAVPSTAFPGCIDIIKSIQTVGGNSKLLKMCYDLNNKKE